MNRVLILGLLAFSVGLGAMWLRANPSPLPSPAITTPIIPIPNCAPTFLTVSTPTTIILTIPIADPSLIVSGVNLLRLNGAGAQTTIIGQLHDDGINGDLVTADHIYSIRFPITATSVGPIQFQVSAAFKGTLQRVTGPLLTIEVYSAAPPLPPDPGAAGMTTIGGVDSDHDGVRDDIQRYIAITYSSSAKMQSALTQVAKAQFAVMVDSTNPALSQLHVLELGYSLECLSASGVGDVNALLTSLENQTLNTAARLKTYLQAEAQPNLSSYKLAADPKSRCLTSPDLFPN